MAAITPKTFYQDLQEPVTVQHCEGTVFSGDNLSTTVRVVVTDGGVAAAALSGSVMCNVIRADGATVSFAGSLAGNVLSATLPQSAMFIPGPIAVMLQLISGSVKTTFLKAIFTADLSATGTAVDPGHTVPDLPELLARLDEMETATAAAEQAAADANAKLAQLDEITELGYPTNTGNGPEVDFAGTINAPLSDIVVYGKSVQAGTPSPAAPVAIQTAGSGGTLGLVACGQNIVQNLLTSAVTRQGITCTPNADGSYTVTGTATSDGVVWLNPLSDGSTPEVDLPTLFVMRQGHTYYVSGLQLRFTKASTGTAIQTINSLLTNPLAASPDIRTPAEDWYVKDVKLLFQTAHGAYNNERFEPQVTEVQNAGWLPYEGSGASLPTPNGLPGIKVASGGNYTDSTGQQWVCDTIDLERRMYTQRVMSVVKDGNHALWGISDLGSNVSFTTYLYTAYPSNPAHGTTWLSDRLVYSAWNADEPGFAGINSAPTQIIIKLPESLAGTTETSIKAWLADNPVTILYDLATPVETPLADAQITALTSLRTYKGGSIIYTTDAVQPEVGVEAFIDIPTYIQQILNQ